MFRDKTEKLFLHCCWTYNRHNFAFFKTGWSESRSRVRKSRYWVETLQVLHPLLWRNETSLLVQRWTMYFPLALLTFVCVHRVLSAHRPVLLCAQNTLIRRYTDVVDSSSGRSYVTEQWHNLPLLRTRGLGSTIGDGQTDRHTHRQTCFLKHIVRLWEWCRIKNHLKKIKVEYFWRLQYFHRSKVKSQETTKNLPRVIK